MPTIDVNGTTLHYERSGHGPALLFIHGMCGDAEVWADQARRFTDRYTCVRYDRRGHTRSARGDAPISVVLHADDAAVLIETLDLAPCLVVASSGGAAIALDLARRHGHLLRGAVLSEPPVFSLDPRAGEVALRELRGVVEAAVAAGGPRAAVDAFFEVMCPGLWAAIDETRRDRYRANAEIGLADLSATAPATTVAALSAVTIPTLVIAGTTSHPSLRSVARVLAAGLPDARFVVLAGSGHVTYAEQPEQFANAVGVFAAEVQRGADRQRPAAAPRLDVRSADGTPLAVWVDGEGPALVLVHGSMCDHTVFEALVSELRDRVTTFAMDRRGFGASGDADGYSIEREFEDVAAVVEAVASRTRAPVALFGHSYGASCAMGGAALTTDLHHLVLYEPSLGLTYPDGAIEAVEAAQAAGDTEGAMRSILVGVAGLSEEDFEALRSSALWSARLATAPTVLRECIAEDGWVHQPGQFDRILTPTMLLAGSESPPALDKVTHLAAAAIPDARIRVLDGHDHFAYRTDPTLVAGIIEEFIGS